MVSKYTNKPQTVDGEDVLRDRAAFYLSCKPEELVVTRLDRAVAGVTGCGKKASYVLDQQTYTWIQNSEVNPSSGAK